MEKSEIRKFYNQEDVVDHYAQATADVGLWLSEEKIFQRIFSTEDRILELGCGAGRIAIGLYELGYDKVFATDYARKMVGRARSAAEILGYPVDFGVQDAINLDFADESFDGAIFGFNGLMHIPGRENRKKAMAEILRVLRPGAYFVFTSHDRNASEHPNFWKAETKRWRAGNQDPDLIDFGDRIGGTPWGELFIHVPEANLIRADLKEVGFRIEADVLRSKIADEPASVKQFSDECRFWVVQRPDGK